MEIKDSGNRTKFASGAVRDMHEGKGRCDLLPLNVVAELLDDPTIQYICEFQKTGNIVYLTLALRFNHVFDNPETLCLEAAKQFEGGAVKYGENNWQKGIPVHCYIDSGIRHYLKFRRGDDDEPHDRAFAWNILCAIWTCVSKPELNDYAKRRGNDDQA